MDIERIKALVAELSAALNEAEEPLGDKAPLLEPVEKIENLFPDAVYPLGSIREREDSELFDLLAGQPRRFFFTLGEWGDEITFSLLNIAFKSTAGLGLRVYSAGTPEEGRGNFFPSVHILSGMEHEGALAGSLAPPTEATGRFTFAPWTDCILEVRAANLDSEKNRIQYLGRPFVR